MPKKIFTYSKYEFVTCTKRFLSWSLMRSSSIFERQSDTCMRLFWLMGIVLCSGIVPPTVNSCCIPDKQKFIHLLNELSKIQKVDNFQNLRNVHVRADTTHMIYWCNCHCSRWTWVWLFPSWSWRATGTKHLSGWPSCCQLWNYSLTPSFAYPLLDSDGGTLLLLYQPSVARMQTEVIIIQEVPGRR